MSNRNTLANKKVRREDRKARKTAFHEAYQARRAKIAAMVERLEATDVASD